jgi:predicted nucleotidyltransferase
MAGRCGESPEKIILFGSYAYGVPDEESDIDIIVITRDEYMPETNREKMQIHHLYNPLIKKFRKYMPIDLIVYTKTMFVKLQETGNYFSQEINQNGKVLYEAVN